MTKQLELFHVAPRDEGKRKVDWSKGGIRTLHLERFKRFRSFELDFDRVTLLVGANSSGKTSILQAIRLFFWCIKVCLRKDNRGSRFDKTVIPFSDFHLIPAHQLRELSFQGVSPNRKSLGIVLRGELESGLVLSFRIYASYSTLMVVDPLEQPERPLTDDQVSHIDRPPLYIPGYFGVVTRELLAHDARLEELLNSGHHNEVLRNMIFRLKAESHRLSRLLEIMKAEFKIAGLNVPFDQKETEFLKAEYVEAGTRIPLDFVSAGSGFLQVLQIMAHSLQNPSPILLLDEPDAHMHHSLQRSFLRVMRAFAQGDHLQVVMASHSETFLRETRLDEIRIVNSRESKAGKFPNAVDLQAELSQAGLWPTHIELAEIFRTKRVLLVENEADEIFLHRVGRLRHKDWDSGNRLLQIVYSKGSDDNTVRRLKIVHDILAKIVPDGVRVSHMRDRDLLCDAAVEALKKEAKEKKVSLRISDRRNRESLLIEPSLIERTLRRDHGNKLPTDLQGKGSIDSLVTKMILDWCNGIVDEMPVRIRDYNRAWVRRTYETDALKEGDKLVDGFIRRCWNEPITKGEIPWKLVDGKTILRELRTTLQGYGITLPEGDILDTMKLSDYDECVLSTVDLVYSWFHEPHAAS